MDGKSEVLSASDLARSIEHVRRAFSRDNLRGLDSLAAQALILISANPGLSVKECSERLTAGQSNVSTAIKRLESEGLVKRQPSKTDPRVHSLAPSASGTRAVQRFLEEAT